MLDGEIYLLCKSISWSDMNRKNIVITITVVVIILSLTAGIIWFETAAAKQYTYLIGAGDKTYTVTVHTNWNSPPEVSLSNASTGSKFISVDFIGSCSKTVTFRITFPTELLGGNITLVWKYYEQNPDCYTVTNDGMQTSVEMTFTHTAIDEHFEVRGTSGAW
jgi:hypothetical protein